MITVKHLTKKYGSHVAVSDLSFTIEKGRIYGFLGPNGAGKSTTMNILTGCLGATEGEVEIDGHNVFEEPMEAKKRIGYLPELPPLYQDMTVREYLQFVTDAKKVQKQEQQKELARVMEKTGVSDVSDRLIRNLSKGYRQRVGLAQALIGNPEVIILDEPTVGLDPKQIIEIRELIRELGKEHTIILSSHILSEVSAVCDSIMILSNGRLVASDTPDNLSKLFAGSVTVTVEVNAPMEKLHQVLGGQEGFGQIAYESGENGAARAKIEQIGDGDIRERLFTLFCQAGVPLVELSRSHVSLEDVFLELTQPMQDDPREQKRRGWHKPKAATNIAQENAAGEEAAPPQPQLENAVEEETKP